MAKLKYRKGSEIFEIFDVLNKFPSVYLLRPNNAGTNVTYDVYRMFIGQLK